MSTNNTDRSYKTLINRRTTDENKSYYEEVAAQTLNIHNNDIWADNVSSTVNTALNQGAVSFYNRLALTEDTSVSNQEAWYAADGDGYRLTDWVSDKYGSDYVVKLYDNTDSQIFPTDALDWFWDYQTGILTINGNASAFSQPFKIDGYQYIGTKGITGGSGSSLYDGESDVQVYIYVNGGSGNDDTGDGSEILPYATINRALDDVPTNVERQFIIEVAAGTYGAYFGEHTIANRFFSTHRLNYSVSHTKGVFIRGAPSTVDFDATINTVVADGYDNTLRVVDIGAFGFSIVPNETFLEIDYFGEPVMLPIVAASSPTVTVVANSSFPTAGQTVKVRDLGCTLNTTNIMGSGFGLYGFKIAGPSYITSLGSSGGIGSPLDVIRLSGIAHASGQIFWHGVFVWGMHVNTTSAGSGFIHDTGMEVVNFNTTQADYEIYNSIYFGSAVRDSVGNTTTGRFVLSNVHVQGLTTGQIYLSGGGLLLSMEKNSHYSSRATYVVDDGVIAALDNNSSIEFEIHGASGSSTTALLRFNQGSTGKQLSRIASCTNTTTVGNDIKIGDSYYSYSELSGSPNTRIVDLDELVIIKN